jgi:hypothetical protein
MKKWIKRWIKSRRGLVILVFSPCFPQVFRKIPKLNVGKIRKLVRGKFGKKGSKRGIFRVFFLK